MPEIHTESHPLAGQKVMIPFQGEQQEYVIEDWWDRVYGETWMFAKGNPACMQYGLRAGVAGIPADDEVVYGKIGGLGHLVHVSEIPTTTAERQ